MKIIIGLLWGLIAFLVNNADARFGMITHGEDMYCISTAEDIFSAIAWLPPNRTKLHTAEQLQPETHLITSAPPELSKQINCLPSLNEGCLFLPENAKDWSILPTTLSSNVKDLLQLLDRSWDKIPAILAKNEYDEDNPHPIPYQNTQIIHMSVLASEIHIVFAQGEKFSTLDKFELIVDGWQNQTPDRTVLRGDYFRQADGKIASKNLQETRSTRDSTLLRRAEKWMNLEISFQYKTYSKMYVQLKVDQKLVKEWQTVNNKNIQISHIFVKSGKSDTALWKLPFNGVLQSTAIPQVPLAIPFHTGNDTEPQLCIELTYRTGYLSAAWFYPFIQLIVNDSHSSQYPPYYFGGSYNWIIKKLIFNVTNNTNYKLMIHTHSAFPLFTIAEIRVFSMHDFYVSKIKKQEGAKCILLQSGMEITHRVKQNSINPFVCKEPGYIPLEDNCGLQCSEIFPNNPTCSGVISCLTQFSSCLPGFSGDNCDIACGNNQFGPECHFECGHCLDQRCHFVSGLCPVGCQDGWLNDFCNITCNPGYHGHECSQTCGHCFYNEQSQTCLPETGLCELGCVKPDYSPPQCKYSRPYTVALPTIRYIGSNNVEFMMPVRDVHGSNDIKTVALQFRKEQPNRYDNTEQPEQPSWQTSTRRPWDWSREPIPLSLKNLQPKTEYEVRVVLNELNEGPGYEFSDLPTIFVKTLCKPIEEPQIMIRVLGDNLIQIEFNVSNPLEHVRQYCDPFNYTILKDENILHTLKSFNETVQVPSPSSGEYVVNVGFTGTSYQIKTINGHSGDDVLIPVIVSLFLLGILAMISLLFWKRWKRRRVKPSDMGALNSSLAMEQVGVSVPLELDLIPETERSPLTLARVVEDPSTKQTNDPDKQPSCRVKVEDFNFYVKEAITLGELKKQHSIFPRGQTQPWKEGKRPEQRSKNRYGNLIAYDATRVKLQPINTDEDSHYINANYIDGYNYPKAYIATQGPKHNTVVDFWRMIWQENVSIIIMLANIVEHGKKKVEQYWPEILRDEETYGDISVSLQDEDVFVEWTFREFRICCDNNQRLVKHFHYRAWPDHGVPRHPHTIATFLRAIMEEEHKVSNRGPIVVHCSAGVGRTGTVLLAHAALQMAQAENAVDLLALVAGMRTQRPNMVDNPEQFEAAHLVVKECLCIPETSVPCDHFPTMAYHMNPEGTREFQAGHIYPQLETLRETELEKYEDYASKWPEDASRYPDIVPGLESKVVLTNPTTGHIEFINAVYVDSLRRVNQFIATQFPLPSTLEDFWLMVLQKQAPIIIVLNEPPPDDDPTYCTFWPAEESLLISNTLQIDLLQEGQVQSSYHLSTIKITHKPTAITRESCREVTLVRLRGWTPGEALPAQGASQLVSLWDDVERLRDGAAPVVVTCYDGASACGVYLAGSLIMERIRFTRKVDVPLDVRTVRHNRPQFVTSIEQYEFLHQMVLEFLDMFEYYANFQ